MFFNIILKFVGNLLSLVLIDICFQGLGDYNMCCNFDDGKGFWCWVDVECDWFGYCFVFKCEFFSIIVIVFINKGC